MSELLHAGLLLETAARRFAKGQDTNSEYVLKMCAKFLAVAQPAPIEHTLDECRDMGCGCRKEQAQ